MLSTKQLLLSLLVLFLSCSVFTTPTKAQTPAAKPSRSICLDEAKARRIAGDLQRYPVVLKENKSLRTANAERKAENLSLRRVITEQDTALAATGRRVGYEQQLRRSAEGQATIYKHKARKRGWITAGLTALLVLVTGAAVSR